MRAHPAAEIFPLLTGDELFALAEDIRQHGLRQPIIEHEGMILDGRNRFAACRLAKVMPVMEQFTGSDPVAFVVSSNIHRRHLTPSQLAMAMARLREQFPYMGTVAAAAAGGISKGLLFNAEAVRDLAIPELVAAVERGDVRVGAALDVAKLEDEEQRALVAEGPERVREAAAEIRNSTYRTTYTGDNEWYTPAQYVEAARKALGEIDLDPASNETAQKTVKAGRFFTAEEDGLKRAWDGRVWLNPPYSQPLVSQFIEKLIAESKAGRAKAAILLVNNSTDTEWFHSAAKSAQAICFTRGRIRFEKPGKESASPLQGSAFFYFGKKPASFAVAFGEIGLIVEVRQ